MGAHFRTSFGSIAKKVGVDEETVLVYATISGVDFISMGGLTHSAPVLDLSLILETLP